MTIVSIKADKVTEGKIFRPIRGLLIGGERPDFIVLSEKEADRIHEKEGGLDYLRNEVVPTLRKQTMNNVLVDGKDGIIRFKRY